MNTKLVAAPAIMALLALALAVAPAVAQGPADPRDTRCVLHVKGMERALERNDLTYRTAQDSVRGFDLFLPPGTTAASRVPLVIFFNAGSGTNPPQRKWGIYRDWAKLVTTRGMAAMLPDAANGNATAEMGAALDHIRAHAATFGIDSGRVAIWGCSMHVTEANRFSVDASRGIDAYVLYYGGADTSAIDRDKPVLLARAGLDMFFTNFAMGAWATKAIRMGVPLTWIDLPSLHHAFDAFEDDELSRSTVATTLDFLQRELSTAGLAARAGSALERRARRLAATQDPGALVAAEAWLASSPESGDADLTLATACYQAKDLARAAKHYESAATRGAQRGTAYYNAACCYALLGDRERALVTLEKAAAAFFGNRAAWASDPDLASLLEEPRFKKLLTP